MRKIPLWVLKRKALYAKAFDAASLPKVAKSLRECAETELLLACINCNHRQYVVYHCESRVCPICSYYLSLDRARFIEKLIAKMKFPKMLTLTIPLQSTGPRDTIKYLRACFQKLRDRSVFKSVKGGAYQIEVKVKEGHFHIHMHVILDSPFIHYTQIYKAWADITGCNGVQVDIRAAKTKAQRAYIVKYSQKAAELKADGSDVVKWWKAVRGSRLFGTFGEWYNVKLEDLLNPDEQQRTPPPCPCCGAVKSTYFARDGAFIFGKDWPAIKGFIISEKFPESRPLKNPGYESTRQQDFLSALGEI